MSDIKFTLSSETIEQIKEFSLLLKKDENQILNEALELYFQNEQKKLLAKNLENENAMTHLDFNEFWDDVDID
jgi:hypothetical protein